MSAIKGGTRGWKFFDFLTHDESRAGPPPSKRQRLVGRHDPTEVSKSTQPVSIGTLTETTTAK